MMLLCGQMQVFANIETTREVFQKDGFELVLDSTQFDHCVGEVEKLVVRREDMEQAASDIAQFLVDHGLTNTGTPMQ